jgi:hypothetical protein
VCGDQTTLSRIIGADDIGGALFFADNADNRSIDGRQIEFFGGMFI